MKKEFDPADFEELAPSKGVLRLVIKDDVSEMDYSARSFVNKDRTIGYSELNVDDIINHMFLSNTKDGLVITMPGEEFGAVPLELEGYRTIFVVVNDTSVEDTYKAHLEALGGAEPIADEAWLKKEVPGIPQRSTTVLGKIFEAAFGLMEDIVEDMSEAFEEAMEQMGGVRVCPACEAEIDKDDKTCPKCGKDL